MALRRFAQANAAGASPKSPSSGSASPASPNGALPQTPPRKPRVSYFDSPSTTPSLSSSTPFDWDAARARKPPPYGTPLQRSKYRKSMGVGSDTPRKRIVRKKGVIEKIKSVPSEIAFQIAIFPHQLPLPTAQTSACLIGGTMHLLNLYVRVKQSTAVPASEMTWEDMYREREGISWFDWTVPITILIAVLSMLNAVYLFTRIKIYHMHKQQETVASPNASWVPVQLDFEPLEPPSLFSRTRTASWRAFVASWRFLLNMSPSNSASPTGNVKMGRVQQLDMWTPGKLELTLFAVYSPAHALLWYATSGANWIVTFAAMGTVGAMIFTMTTSYESLIKDKMILAAEVMHEYDEKFVYPRVNPVRRDVAVMTHQSECVNVWED